MTSFFQRFLAAAGAGMLMATAAAQTAPEAAASAPERYVSPADKCRNLAKTNRPELKVFNQAKKPSAYLRAEGFGCGFRVLRDDESGARPDLSTVYNFRMPSEVERYHGDYNRDFDQHQKATKPAADKAQAAPAAAPAARGDRDEKIQAFRDQRAARHRKNLGQGPASAPE